MNIEEHVRQHGIIGVGSDPDPVRMVQRALVASGAVIHIDGEFGAITESAVKRFQAAHVDGAERQLTVDGQVGPLTAWALDQVELLPETEEQEESGSLRKSAPWLAEMRAITGVREVPGSRNSPIIMSWRSDIGKAFPDLARYAATYTGDAIPWCGFGLARCCAVWGVKPPASFMWALSWSKWGTKLPRPIVGSIMTFKREGGGHVAVLEKISGNTVWVRGCNQSDMVNVARMSMTNFVAATWPKGWPIPKRSLEGNILNSVDGGRLA